MNPISFSRRRFLLFLSCLLFAASALGLHATIFDGGVDSMNLGKGDWIYFIQDATNHLGGNVPQVHDLPTFATYEASQGMKYIIVKAGDGGIDFNGNYAFPQFNSNLVYQAHAAGLQIFGYTRSQGTNIPAEIAMAAKIYNLGADGFVLDAEAEWESSRLGTNGPSLAIQLCSAIKSQFPTKFLGLSPLPIISFHSSFPYAQFGYYCDTVMPQDYWQDGGLGALVNYSPSNMVTRMDTEWRNWQQGLTGQWTNAIKPIAPVAQGWNPTSTNITTGAQITQFFNALKGDPNPVGVGGYNGVNFWRADLHTADMWTGIGGNTIGRANSAPSITNQPQSQTIWQGGNVTFTVAASGYPPPSYQWQFNGSDISGATNTSYKIIGVQTNNQGNYSVFVSNSVSSTNSSNAFLTVFFPPIIGTQPQPLTVAQGSNATFTVTASGNPSPDYQWQLNGTNIAGANSATYIVTNAQLTNQGNYSAIATNVVGSTTSSNAALTVNAPPFIKTQPVSRNVIQGKTTVITVSVTGSPTLSFQWQLNGTNIPGATTNPYVITNAQPGQAGSYQLVITNSFGAVTSAVATLTVISPPAILNQPRSQSVTTGSNAMFAVTATGGNLTYQWLFNGAAIGSATNSTCTISNAQTNNTGNYSVVVTNLAGSITSSNALLSVSAQPFQFQSIQLLPGGLVQLTLVGVTGSNCWINFYSNLVDWNVLTNLVNSNGTIQFTDAITTNAAFRAYRAQFGGN